MNRNFCKLIDRTKIEFAPDSVRVSIPHKESWTDEEGVEHVEEWNEDYFALHPTADDYRLAVDGPYLPFVRDHEEREGFIAVKTGYEEKDGSVVCVYNYEPVPPPPPRKWSRLSLIRGLKAAGLWERAENAMNDDVIFELLACDYVLEDDKVFSGALESMRAEFGAETVNALLDSLPLEA